MVRCVKCGFLTARNPETRLLEEIDQEAREYGNFPTVNIGLMMLGLGPQCFRMAADLGAECREVKETIDDQEADGRKIILSVITKDRDCPEFTTWHVGFSPKEHRMMLFDVERKKLEIQERENERRWQEKREQKQRRFQLANTLISAVVGAICTAVIGGFLAGRWAAKSGPQPATTTQPVQTEKADKVKVDH